MGDMNDGQMIQQLLARDVVRFVGEPVAVVVTEGRYQGEDAAELVDVDYDPLPAVVDMADAAAETRPCCSPRRARNVAVTFGDAAALRPDLFDGCEVGGLPHDPQPAGRARADGDPGRGRGRGARTAG